MMRIQFWLFVSAMAGFVVAAITLLVTSHSGFVGDYNSYAQPFTHHADTYSYFMAQAKAGGIATHAPTNWHNTIIASGAFIAFGVWTWYSVNYAGEIRQAGTRRNWYSMLGGLALTFIPILLMVLLLEKTVSLPFLIRGEWFVVEREGVYVAEPAVVDYAGRDDGRTGCSWRFWG